MGRPSTVRARFEVSRVVAGVKKSLYLMLGVAQPFDGLRRIRIAQPGDGTNSFGGGRPAAAVPTPVVERFGSQLSTDPAYVGVRRVVDEGDLIRPERSCGRSERLGESSNVGGRQLLGEGFEARRLAGRISRDLPGEGVAIYGGNGRSSHQLGRVVLAFLLQLGSECHELRRFQYPGH